MAPEFHVLLSPELMDGILKAFIDFFAGVAVPPPFSRDAMAAHGDGESGTGTDMAAATAAEVPAAAGPALPTPSPNLVFASLQVTPLCRSWWRWTWL